MTKRLDLDSLVHVRQKLRAEGKRVVFANGIFDVLHAGHIEYLAASRALGDVLIVGVNSDASERELKGPGRPIYKEHERLALLEEIRFVDYIIVFEEATCENLLRSLHPDVHSKGTDYTAETVPERAVAIELGIDTAIAGPPKENASRGLIATVIDRFGNDTKQ